VNELGIIALVVALACGLLLGGLWLAERLSEFFIGRMRL
jgi:uncharacterized protein YneF (UPF0154 family)